MTGSLTNALEEMTINNEQLRREVDILTTDNDAMKDNIDKQRDLIRELRAENIQLKTENDDLRTHTGTNKPQPLPRARQQPKVSQWSEIT